MSCMATRTTNVLQRLFQCLLVSLLTIPFQNRSPFRSMTYFSSEVFVPMVKNSNWVAVPSAFVTPNIIATAAHPTMSFGQSLENMWVTTTKEQNERKAHNMAVWVYGELGGEMANDKMQSSVSLSSWSKKFPCRWLHELRYFPSPFNCIWSTWLAFR